MTEHAEHRSTRPVNRWRLAGWSAAALCLLLPLAAMPFTDEVAWGPMDFLLAGALVAGVGLGCELAVRRSGNRAYRAGAGLALVTAFMLVGANAAVGIIGAEDEPVNWLFHGVPVVGLAAALTAGFRANGLIRAMLLMALAQAVAVGLALRSGHGIEPVTFIFTALWMGAAGLFWKAGKTDNS